MKALTLFAAGSLLVVSTPASALHCEKQINEFLEIYQGDARTEKLAAPITAKDFTKVGRTIAKPKATDRSKNQITEIQFKGATDGDKSKEVVITAKGYRENPHPGTSSTSPFTALIPDLVVTLAPDCKLKSFTVYDFRVKAKDPVTLLDYDNEPVVISASECLDIYSKSKSTNPEILKDLKKSTEVQQVYLSRVIPNCRHRSSASASEKISVGIMASLSADVSELNKRYTYKPKESDKSYPLVDPIKNSTSAGH